MDRPQDSAEFVSLAFYFLDVAVPRDGDSAHSLHVGMTEVFGFVGFDLVAVRW